MIRPLAQSLLVFLILSTPAVAGPLDGAWDATPEACGAEGSDAGITIADGKIRFYESVCTMGPGEPVSGIPSAWIHDMTCEGEGETWSQRTLMALMFEGTSLFLLTDGIGYEVVRCD